MLICTDWIHLEAKSNAFLANSISSTGLSYSSRLMRLRISKDWDAHENCGGP